MFSKVLANSVLDILDDFIFIVGKDSVTSIIDQTDLRVIVILTVVVRRDDIRFIGHRLILFFFSIFLAMLRVIGITLFLELSCIVHQVGFQLGNICLMLILLLLFIALFVLGNISDYGLSFGKCCLHRINLFLRDLLVIPSKTKPCRCGAYCSPS